MAHVAQSPTNTEVFQSKSDIDFRNRAHDDSPEEGEESGRSSGELSESADEEGQVQAAPKPIQLCRQFCFTGRCDNGLKCHMLHPGQNCPLPEGMMNMMRPWGPPRMPGSVPRPASLWMPGQQRPPMFMNGPRGPPRMPPNMNMTMPLGPNQGNFGPQAANLPPALVPPSPQKTANKRHDIDAATNQTNANDNPWEASLKRARELRKKAKQQRKQAVSNTVDEKKLEEVSMEDLLNKAKIDNEKSAKKAYENENYADPVASEPVDATEKMFMNVDQNDILSQWEQMAKEYNPGFDNRWITNAGGATKEPSTKQKDLRKLRKGAREDDKPFGSYGGSQWVSNDKSSKSRNDKSRGRARHRRGSSYSDRDSSSSSSSSGSSSGSSSSDSSSSSGSSSSSASSVDSYAERRRKRKTAEAKRKQASALQSRIGSQMVNEFHTAAQHHHHPPPVDRRPPNQRYKGPPQQPVSGAGPYGLSKMGDRARPNQPPSGIPRSSYREREDDQPPYHRPVMPSRQEPPISGPLKMSLGSSRSSRPGVVDSSVKESFRDQETRYRPPDLRHSPPPPSRKRPFEESRDKTPPRRMPEPKSAVERKPTVASTVSSVKKPSSSSKPVVAKDDFVKARREDLLKQLREIDVKIKKKKKETK